MPTKLHDTYEKLFNHFFAAGEVVEIRALNLSGRGPWASWARGQVSGYFDDAGKFAQAAKKLEDLKKASGIYFTLNPVNPALLARAANRLKAADITTSDKDIVCLRWLPIDTDPERPTGISATDEEEKASLEVRDQVAAWLKESDWPAPIKARSGNGGHLLYRLPDLEPTQENIELLKRCLQALSAKFTTDTVKIDEKVFNPARIWKLYGTTGRKGDSTRERPHRRSRIESIPKDPAATVTLEQLQELAALAPEEAKPARQPRQESRDQDLGPLDVGAYLRHYGVEYNVKEASGRMLFRLSHCLFDHTHRKNESAIIQDSAGMLTYQCFHDSCKGWQWKDARQKISGEDKIARFCEGYEEGRAPRKPQPPPGAGDPSQNGASRFFFGKKFRPKFLADEILAENEYVSVPDYGIFQYKDYWQELHESNIHKIGVEKLETEASRARVMDACFQVMTRSAIPAGQELNPFAGELICLKNGMLDLNTKELLDFDKNYLSTIQVNASFNPRAKCPRWMRFWEETLGDVQKIKIMQEWTGYCLTKDVSHHKSLFLVGPGSDGKSTYLKMLEHLVGHDARTNVTLRDLENEFYRVTLFGKLLNVSTETEFTQALTSDFFKAIVSGESITAAHKNKPVFSFRPFCKLAFGMNRLPRARDYSYGFYRRIIIIKFTRQFLGEEEDKNLFNVLLEEIDGILNWALVGLDRLREQGGFTESEDVNQIMREYQIENNPVLAFVEDKCTTKTIFEERPLQVKKQDLFNAYKEFCESYNYRPLGAAYFFRLLRDQFPHIKSVRLRDGGEREYYVQGIAFKPIGADVA